MHIHRIVALAAFFVATPLFAAPPATKQPMMLTPLSFSCPDEKDVADLADMNNTATRTALHTKKIFSGLCTAGQGELAVVIGVERRLTTAGNPYYCYQFPLYAKLGDAKKVCAPPWMLRPLEQVVAQRTGDYSVMLDQLKEGRALSASCAEGGSLTLLRDKGALMVHASLFGVQTKPYPVADNLPIAQVLQDACQGRNFAFDPAAQ